MKTVTFFLHSWIKCQQSHHPLSWSDPKIWSQRGLDSFPLPSLPQIARITKSCQLDLQITVWLHLLLSFNTATSSKTSSATWTSTVVPLACLLPLWPPYSQSLYSCLCTQLLSRIRIFATPWPWTCPWDFLGKNTGVGYLFLFQGIFQTQGLSQYLLHWQVNSLPLSHLSSPHSPYTKVSWMRPPSCLFTIAPHCNADKLWTPFYAMWSGPRLPVTSVSYDFCVGHYDLTTLAFFISLELLSSLNLRYASEITLLT